MDLCVSPHVTLLFLGMGLNHFTDALSIIVYIISCRSWCKNNTYTQLIRSAYISRRPGTSPQSWWGGPSQSTMRAPFQAGDSTPVEQQAVATDPEPHRTWSPLAVSYLSTSKETCAATAPAPRPRPLYAGWHWKQDGGTVTDPTLQWYKDTW